MLAIGLISIILGIAFGTGQALLEHWKMLNDSWLEEFVSSVALGLAVLIHLVMIWGLLGYLYWWSIAGTLICLACLFFQRILTLVKRFCYFWRQWSFTSYTPFEKLLLLGLSIYAVLYLLIALAPPARWDGIHYLFPTAQTYIRSHRIHFIPYLYTMRPKNMVMLYVIGYLLQGETLALLFNYLLTSLTLVLTYRLALRYVDRKYALLAAAIFYTMPLTGMIASGSLSESGVVLYGLLALYALLHWWDSLQWRWIFLAGLLSGLASGFKIIALQVPLLIGALIFFRFWKIQTMSSFRQAIQKLFFSLAIFAGAAILAGGGWYYLTYSWTGTPLYSGENLERMFEKYVEEQAEGNTAVRRGELEDTALQNAELKTQNLSQTSSTRELLVKYFQRGLSLFTRFGPKKLGVYAWNMSMGKDHQHYLTSPLFLIFLPLWIFFPLHYKKGAVLIVFAALYCVIGVNLWGNYNRYIIPVFPILSILTARVIQNMASETRFLNRFTKSIALFLCLIHMPVIVHAGINHLPVVLGISSRENFLNRSHPGSFKVAQYVNKNLPASATVLIHGDSRLFLFERDYIVGGFLSLLMQYHHFEDPEYAYQRLQELGVTHVIFNESARNDKEFDDRVVTNTNSGYSDKNNYIRIFKRRYLKYIYHDASVFLYEIKREI